jgi:hypothetical protein
MERGNYRSIYTVVVDGPEFQALSPGAKLVWYTLKMTLGPSGIAVIPALVPTLVERTGASTAHVEKAIVQLIADGWVKQERNVVWMVDGLRHDPHLSLSNQNHRTQIAKHINGLPRLPIIDLFRAHYGLSAPPIEMPSTPAEHGLSDASKMASPIPSKMGSKKPSPSREKGKGEGKRETEEGGSAATGAAGRKPRAGRPTWLTTFADAWRAKFGGEMSAGKAVSALSRLVAQHGAEETLRRWDIYLAATAAEYANAPKFAETWGRWAAAVVRPVAGAVGPSVRDQAKVEAGNQVAQIRELIFEQPIPGQGARRLLRNADVERLGEDVSKAYRTVGGAARFLAIDAKPDDLPFLINAFADALHAARNSDEAKSA